MAAATGLAGHAWRSPLDSAMRLLPASPLNGGDVGRPILRNHFLECVDADRRNPGKTGLVALAFAASAEAGLAEHRVVGEPPGDQEPLFLKAGESIAPIFFMDGDGLVAACLKKFGCAEIGAVPGEQSHLDEIGNGEHAHRMDIARAGRVAGHPAGRTEAEARQRRTLGQRRVPKDNPGHDEVGGAARARRDIDLRPSSDRAASTPACKT